ncbi:MAG TPA: hypothetical protein PKI11_13700 [Candidatus Hydrogenedentes bacterium]|nr:hypothetical protein [Candidatus Hydrogenedentota bacterium]HNT88160.1 hypothetical protein [Candidatus Hydrogenedentota bacterium]
MQRIHPVTRLPAGASNIPPEVKLTFARDLIEISIPLFENKNPSNPLPDTGGGDTT